MKAHLSLTPVQILSSIIGTTLLTAVLSGCSPKPPAHGTAFTLSLGQAEPTTPPITVEQKTATKAALQKRLKRLGVPAHLELLGDAQLRLAVPTMPNDELNAVRKTISRSGVLAFRLVHPQNDELVSQGTSAPGYELLKHTGQHRNGNKTVESMLVEKVSGNAFPGAGVESAAVTRNQMGEPEIAFSLDATATATFAQITRDNIGRRLAIVLDGKLYSAPIIQGEIPGGRGQITGSFTHQEAMELASLLGAPLPVPVQIVEEKSF